MSRMQGAVAVDLDPFSDEFLSDPCPFHERLREAAPVVWLERYGIFASARHAEVQTGLTDWQTFSSAAGVGIDDFRRSKPWRPPSLILEADPPLHTRSRTVLNRALSAKAMAGLRESFRQAAEQFADAVVKRRHVDAIKDIAEAYPLSVFPRAVGLRPEGLENLLPYGTMVFNGFGPRNAHFEASMARAAEVVGWINQQCLRENLTPGGLGATIWAAVDSGDVTAEEAPILVRSLLSAGLDTTIIGIGNGLYALASNPEQWQGLRADPSLVRPAFDEILRWESPVQIFFRTTTRPAELGGVALPADVSRRRESRSATVGRPNALRCDPEGERPCRLRRGHSHACRANAGAARIRDDPRRAALKSRENRDRRRAQAQAQQQPAAIRQPAHRIHARVKRKAAAVPLGDTPPF
jgi:cytochrome P450